MSKVIVIFKWECDNCHTVFYAHLDAGEGAICPKCGRPATCHGAVKFIPQDDEFMDAVERIFDQDCCEGCWVFDAVPITEEERRELKEAIQECGVARLRRILGYKELCPAECE